jgi:hypothetical protein
MPLLDEVIPCSTPALFRPRIPHGVDEPIVLWESERRMTDAYVTSKGVYPQADAHWIEDRFWVWVHYGSLKVARGELQESLDSGPFSVSPFSGRSARRRGKRGSSQQLRDADSNVVPDVCSDRKLLWVPGSCARRLTLDIAGSGKQAPRP